MIRCHHRPPAPPTATLPTSWPRLSSACVPAGSRRPSSARSSKRFSGPADDLLSFYALKQQTWQASSEAAVLGCSQAKQPCRELPGPRSSPGPRCKAGSAPQLRRSRKRRSTVVRKLHAVPAEYMAQGLWRICESPEQGFIPGQPLTGPHPVVIAGLRLSSALLGGEVR